VFDESVDQAFEPLLVPVLGRTVRSAELLATLDPELYATRLDEWLDSNVDIALGRDVLPQAHFKKNRERFDWLAKLVARRRVIPFIGAGSSASCGVPTWTGYLTKLAVERSYPIDELRRDIAEGRYEDAATGLVRHIGEAAFRESFDRSFADLPAPATDTLPSIVAATFDGPIITTNYDQLLEGATAPLQTFLGSSPGEFQLAAGEGGRALLKIQGDLYQPGARVLTKKEYDKAYGAHDVPDWSKALPRVLRWVFLRDTVVFLGASLSNDRTMRLLRVLAQDKIEGPSMRHFAIVEFPGKLATVRERERFLAERSIFPIWYAAGEHSLVRDLVQSLARVARDLR